MRRVLSAMSDLLNDILAYIATPSGFIVFITAITLAYGGIWFLFLFEGKPPSKKVSAKAEGEREKEPEEAPKSTREKQPAPSG